MAVRDAPLLLTWSDRGTNEPRPDHHAPRPKSDLGPILRLLDQPESGGRYGAVRIVTQSLGATPARELVAAVRERVPDVTLDVVDVRDPTDFAVLFETLIPIVESLPRDRGIDVLLSAGTPQVQALWLILVKAGLLRARMLQVIPSVFVPSIHPRAIREVRLDIDGFPEIQALRAEVLRLRAETSALAGSMVSHSAPMRELSWRIGRVANSEVPVLIHGETGTGKELVARAIHDASARQRGPFVAENCGAFSDSVLPSELFGHERGAFTGAVNLRRGLFEMAHGGTLFLDEVAELTPRVQVSLLRVLQDGTVRRVGGERSINVDVRVIAATHRDLATMVSDGSFREDLFYRLKGATLTVPALRDRVGDLDPLIAQFLNEAHREDLQLSRDAWRSLQSYRWPGNVRELRAEVMRWTVFCDHEVSTADLADDIDTTPVVTAPATAAHVAALPRPLVEVVGAAERAAIAAAMSYTESNLSQAARLLQIDRNTLKRKLRRSSR